LSASIQEDNSIVIGSDHESKVSFPEPSKQVVVICLAIGDVNGQADIPESLLRGEDAIPPTARHALRFGAGAAPCIARSFSGRSL